MGSLDAAQQFMSQDDPALAEKAGEKAHDADKDQIERDDDIQQTGHYENQNARDERHQWSDSKFWHETFPSGLNTVCPRGTPHFKLGRFNVQRNIRTAPFARFYALSWPSNDFHLTMKCF